MPTGSERRGAVEVGVARQDRGREVARHAEGEDVDDGAADDLVDGVADRQDAEHQPEEGADGDPAEHAGPLVVGGAGDDRPGEGAEQEHALDGDVDDSGALAQDPGQGAERQRGGPPQRAGEQPDERRGTAGRRPHEHGEHEQDHADGEHDRCPPRREAGGGQDAEDDGDEPEHDRRRPGRDDEVGERVLAPPVQDERGVADGPPEQHAGGDAEADGDATEDAGLVVRSPVEVDDRLLGQDLGCGRRRSVTIPTPS